MSDQQSDALLRGGRELQFERVTCPNCDGNIYRFVVEDPDGEVRIIDLPPNATVSDLQNRL